MNGETNELVQKAHLDTIYCARDVFYDNCLKTIQPERITEQYQLAVDSLKHKDKFLNFIAPEE